MNGQIDMDIKIYSQVYNKCGYNKYPMLYRIKGLENVSSFC